MSSGIAIQSVYLLGYLWNRIRESFVEEEGGNRRVELQKIRSRFWDDKVTVVRTGLEIICSTLRNTSERSVAVFTARVRSTANVMFLLCLSVHIEGGWSGAKSGGRSSCEGLQGWWGQSRGWVWGGGGTPQNKNSEKKIGTFFFATRR